MLISCPRCPKVYDVADEALSPAGRDVVCCACGHEWFERPVEAFAPAPIDFAFTAQIIDAIYRDVTERSSARSEDDRDEALIALPPPEGARPHFGIAPLAAPPSPADEDRAAAAMGADLAQKGWRGRAKAAWRARRRSRPELTPGDRAAKKWRRRAQRRLANRLTPMRVAGWAIWVGTAAGLGALGTMNADAIAAKFPAAAHLARTEPAPSGQITGLATRLAESLEGPVLELTGVIVNDTDREILPRLRLSPADGAPEEAVLFSVSAVPLPAGGERPFTVRASWPYKTRPPVLAVAAEGESPAGPRMTMRQVGSGWGHPDCAAGDDRCDLSQ